MKLVLLQKILRIWMCFENVMFSVEEEMLGHLFPPKHQFAVVKIVKNLYQESCFVENCACLIS